MRKTTPQQLAKSPFPLPDTVTKVIPAPTGGWDAISPLANMDPSRAPIMNNWVPRPGWIELRSGFTPWAWVGVNSPVETLMVYRALGNEKMFAAAGGSIFDISTTYTSGGYTTAVTGLSSNRFSYASFTPSLAPTVIQCANGTDPIQMYNGTSWSVPSITGFPGGLTSNDVSYISSQKQRLWYVMTNGSPTSGSTICAYLDSDAISGAIAGSIDLGSYWNKGGYLIAIGDWTVDGGSGPQDYTVFVSSKGQVSVFAGTDPTSATSWGLVATFNISPPISNRCLTQVGSDLGIITQQGLVPISTALPFDPSADRSVAITARIQNAMATDAIQAKDNFGWQFLTFPAQQLAILNIPLVENVNQVQFVMNSITGAWCQFQGWNANCFEIFNSNLYFGGNDGTINWAYQGALDLNQPIAANVQCAFNYFDDPGRLKRVTMVQPLMIASGNITPLISIDEDFATSNNQAPVTILSGGATWSATNPQASQFVGSISGTALTVSSVTSGSLAIGQVLSDIAPYPQTSFTGSISGTTLTVTEVGTGVIVIGQLVTDLSGKVTAGTIITGGSGLSWTVNTSQTVAATTLYGLKNTIAYGTTITAGSGLSWTVDTSQTVSSETMYSYDETMIAGTDGVWNESLWPGATQTINPWLSTQAIGHALAIHLNVNVQAAGAVPAVIGEFDIGVFDSAQFDAAVSSIAPQLQINAFNAIVELGGFV